jgi:hypothetical protein
MPPVTPITCEYAAFSVPLGRAVVVMLGAGATVRLNTFVAVEDALSVTFTVNVKDPTAVGEPEMAPVAGFSASPAGNAPTLTDQVKGGAPAAAVIVWAYAAPAVIDGSVGAVVILSPATTTIDNASVAGDVKALSLNWTVKLNVPATVGLPVMAPVAELSDREVGSDPAITDQVKGGTPPVPARTWL